MPLRLALAAALVTLWSVLGASPALDADPPADVVLDGVVTVTFADPSVDGGAGLPDASVTLTARRPDLGADAAIQTLDGTTNADGRVVFDGVARPADGAPPVELAAMAKTSRVSVTDDGCLQAEDLEGTATADAAVSVSMAVGVGSASSSLDCSPLVVTGTVLDGDGQPFVAATASATLTTPDGDQDVSVTIGDDGAFRIELPRWDPSATATLELTVTSAPTKTVDTGDGCGDTYALVATHTWKVADPVSAPDPVALIAKEQVVGQVCEATGTPKPTAQPTTKPTASARATAHETDGGSTLPPTDTVPGGRPPGSADLGPALAILVQVTLVAISIAARGVRRRGPVERDPSD